MKTELTKKLAEALDITAANLCKTSANKNFTNCKDLDKPVELVKEKLKLVSGKEQIRILTLAPKSCSINKTVQEFSVTEHKVKCAKDLKKELSRVKSENRKKAK